MNTAVRQVPIAKTLRIVLSAAVLAPALLLAGCKNPVPQDQAGNDVVCVYERVTGSNLPVRTCRTAAERAALAAQMEEAAQQEILDQRRLDEFGDVPNAAAIQ